MMLNNVKPTINRQKASIMTHPADVAGDKPTNLATFLPKTNTNFNPAHNLGDFPMLHILAKIRMQPNVMHGQRLKPHIVCDFIAVCPG